MRFSLSVFRLCLATAATALVILACGSSAKADAVYTYKGNPFAYNGSVYALTGVQGSLTLSSALAPNTTTNLLPESVGGTISSYDFSDGHYTWNLGNYLSGTPCGGSTTDCNTEISLTTDGSGAIESWNIFIYSSVGAINTQSTLSTDGTNLFYNYDAYSPCSSPYCNGGQASGVYTAGTWTETITPTQTPEPGSLLLLGSGLAGLSAGLRRKSRRIGN